MCDGPRENQFLLEAGENVGLAGQLRADHLQRNQAIEFLVARLVDRPHSTFAEQFQDFVTAGDEVAGLEGQTGTCNGRLRSRRTGPSGVHRQMGNRRVAGAELRAARRTARCA